MNDNIGIGLDPKGSGSVNPEPPGPGSQNPKGPAFLEDPLFGYSGPFYFPLRVNLAYLILEAAEQDGFNFTNSSVFLSANVDRLSGLMHTLEELVADKRAHKYWGDIYQYDIFEESVRESIDDQRSEFLESVRPLEDWPLPTLIVSAFYRCMVDEITPYHSLLWTLKQSPKLQSKQVQELLEAGEFDKAILFANKSVNLEHLKTTGSLRSNFWLWILIFVFLSSKNGSLSTEVTFEFRKLIERNPSFLPFLREVSKKWFAVFNVSELISLKNSKLKSIPLIPVFFILSVLNLLVAFGLKEEDAQKALLESVAKSSKLPIAERLAEIHGPIYNY